MLIVTFVGVFILCILDIFTSWKKDEGEGRAGRWGDGEMGQCSIDRPTSTSTCMSTSSSNSLFGCQGTVISQHTMPEEDGRIGIAFGFDVDICLNLILIPSHSSFVPVHSIQQKRRERAGWAGLGDSSLRDTYMTTVPSPWLLACFEDDHVMMSSHHAQAADASLTGRLDVHCQSMHATPLFITRRRRDGLGSACLPKQTAWTMRYPSM